MQPIPWCQRRCVAVLDANHADVAVGCCAGTPRHTSRRACCLVSMCSRLLEWNSTSLSPSPKWYLWPLFMVDRLMTGSAPVNALTQVVQQHRHAAVDGALQLGQRTSRPVLLLLTHPAHALQLRANQQRPARRVLHNGARGHRAGCRHSTAQSRASLSGC